MTTWVDNSQKVNETNISKMGVTYNGVYPPSDYAGHGMVSLSIAIPGHWIVGEDTEITTSENAVLFVRTLQQKAVEIIRLTQSTGALTASK